MSGRSKFLAPEKHIYTNMFVPIPSVPPQKSAGKAFQIYCWNLQSHLRMLFEKAHLSNARRLLREKGSLTKSEQYFGVIQDDGPIFVPQYPLGDPTEECHFAQICTQTDRKAKPTGIIFGNLSYLLLEETVAWKKTDGQLYLVMYAYHYGMMKGEEEVYHFRFERESDYEVEPGSKRIVNVSDYKPLHHFHGNSSEPHFQDFSPDFPNKIDHIVDLLKINIPRLDQDYGPCDPIK